MIKRVLKIIFAILLIPVAISATLALYNSLAGIRYFSKNQAYFLAGAVTYLVVHVLLYKPITLYVFGHELQHAIATWLCGGKVKGFSVSKKGGNVTVTKSNTFIALAPYILPIYTILVVLVYVISSWFFDMSLYVGYFIFLIGATLVFHIVLTIDVMRKEQSDIIKSGFIFSLVIIYLANIIAAAFILSLVFDDISISAYFGSLYDMARSIYIGVFNQLFSR